MTLPGSGTARLRLPTSALGGCILLTVERDTRGIVLSDEQHFNYYPATPFPMISWIFEGSLHLVEDPGSAGTPELGPALPRVVLSGPHRNPSASWSPGPVHALSVAFTPDGLFELFGISIEHVIDTMMPLTDIASGPLATGLIGVEPTDQSEAFDQIEAILTPAWSAARPGQHLASVRGWTHALMVRAAFSRPGTGVRQAQRSIKARTGHSQRDLARYARLEETMGHIATHPSDRSVNLADLAATVGYADQSHMGREVRRSTGVAPGRLLNLIKSDEGFWFYRLLESHQQQQ